MRGKVPWPDPEVRIHGRRAGRAGFAAGEMAAVAAALAAKEAGDQEPRLEVVGLPPDIEPVGTDASGVDGFVVLGHDLFEVMAEDIRRGGGQLLPRNLVAARCDGWDHPDGEWSQDWRAP